MRYHSIIRLDFGDSLYDKRPVLEMIAECILATVELTGLALTVGLLADVSIGIDSAVKQGSFVKTDSGYIYYFIATAPTEDWDESWPEFLAILENVEFH
jgi:ABC-type dipeptide/oligopeptide/nickel transport system permease component